MGLPVESALGDLRREQRCLPFICRVHAFCQRLPSACSLAAGEQGAQGLLFRLQPDATVAAGRPRPNNRLHALDSQHDSQAAGQRRARAADHGMGALEKELCETLVDGTGQKPAVFKTV